MEEQVVVFVVAGLAVVCLLLELQHILVAVALEVAIVVEIVVVVEVAFAAANKAGFDSAYQAVLAALVEDVHEPREVDAHSVAAVVAAVETEAVEVAYAVS